MRSSNGEHDLEAERAEGEREREIRDAGTFPLYLPTYSPELNPIELLWADMKQSLRSLAISTHVDLLRTVRPSGITSNPANED